MKLNNLTLPLIALVFAAACFAGCINLEQKTVLNSDGSGTMNVHYWTKNSNLNYSKEMGGFSFDESRAKTNYSSANTEVLSAKMEETPGDSTTHVRVELKFKNINELTKAKAFDRLKISWKEGKDGMDFTYSIPEDSTDSHIIGAASYKIIYEFEFPGEVLETNGTKGGNKVVWNKSLADLKADLVLTATVKPEGKKCGLFGMEFPLLALAGIAMLTLRNRKKK